MKYRVSEDGSVPVLYCERVKRWLAVEDHSDCEHCTGVVYDENGDPVSFLCDHHCEKRSFQPDHTDPSEEGRGYPTPDHDTTKP